MDFSHVERTHHPRDRVFGTHRDELEAVVASLPEVQRVELRHQTEHAGGRIEQAHRWVGSALALPLLVRPFVGEHMLVWNQVTTWDPHDWRADWEIDVPALGAAMTCRGVNLYHDDAGGTRIEVQGAFEFFPERVAELQRVPISAVPMVERMVVSLIVPLIQRSGHAVSDYLSARGG